MKQDHYRKLERMYLNANINTALYQTTTCEIDHKTSSISLEVSDNYFHALGAMHGSVYFKLLDDAAFFAVNSIVDDVFVLTTSFNINILRPVNAGIITGIGKVRFVSKQLFIAESTLYNEKGKAIAIGNGQFVKSTTPLTSDIGYQ